MKRNYWEILGKVAFAFSVLWFFGLMLNIMLLAELAVGFALFIEEMYHRFKASSKIKDETPVPEAVRKFLAEKNLVIVKDGGENE